VTQILPNFLQAGVTHLPSSRGVMEGQQPLSFVLSYRYLDNPNPNPSPSLVPGPWLLALDILEAMNVKAG